jgi:hypothetical protein
MAVTSPAPAHRPRQHLFWSRVHFVIRLLGLTGGLLACICGVFAAIQGEFQTLQAAADVRDAATVAWTMARSAFEAPQANETMVLFLASAAAALLALLVELMVVLCFTATRRSAFGFNALLQGTLAAVLFAGVNVWSFSHYQRVDYTRDRQFTLPDALRDDLTHLAVNRPTTVIVYQRHKTFGLQSDKARDDIESAAERKIVEKVKDLADQFRAVGPQIKVEVLDVQAKDFKQRLKEATEESVRRPRPPDAQPSEEEWDKQLAEEAEALRKTIESAPENSLFFCAAGGNNKLHVQRLSFNDFYQLDKTASQDDRNGRGNLVLLYQGVEPFARRLLHLEERRPRIGIATIHEVLSTGSQRDIGLHGLRAALEARGFEVKDIVLKKEGNGPLGLQPAAYSLDESTLEGLKNREKLYRRNRDTFEQARAETAKERDFWKKAPDDEKTRNSLLKQIGDQAADRAQEIDDKLGVVELAIQRYRQALTSAETDAVRARLRKDLAQLEEVRPQLIESRDLWKKAIKDEKARELLFRQVVEEKVAELDGEIQRFDEDIQDYQQRLAATKAEKAKLNEPALREQQRMTDLKAKLQRLLADCDLLIVPRMTLRNTASLRDDIPPQVYPLDKAQVEAIKEFLKDGKPILACFGPLNWPANVGNLDEARPDGLEDLLTQLGVKLGKQTVLFDAEEEGFAENRAGLTIAGAGVEVPPLIWDWRSGDGLPSGSAHTERPINRIRDSVRLTARGLGKGEALDLRIRLPRPIYYVPPEPTKARQLVVQAIAALVQANWATQTLSLAALDRFLFVAAQQPPDPVFLMTNPRSWNEDDPFPSEGRIPQFDQPKRDKDKGRQLKPATPGLDARRRGPFPIGVAVETPLPQDWYGSSATVRLAVIGQGGFFTGKELPPAQEKVIVHTLNWLLGRDDRLPRDERVWSYPRVNDTIPADSPTEYLWLWGVRLGLPVLFLYLGFVVLLFRRLR